MSKIYFLFTLLFFLSLATFSQKSNTQKTDSLQTVFTNPKNKLLKDLTVLNTAKESIPNGVSKSSIDNMPFLKIDNNSVKKMPIAVADATVIYKMQIASAERKVNNVILNKSTIIYANKNSKDKFQLSDSLQLLNK